MKLQLVGVTYSGDTNESHEKPASVCSVESSAERAGSEPSSFTLLAARISAAFARSSFCSAAMTCRVMSALSGALP